MKSCVLMFTLITLECYPENVLTASYFITIHRGSFNINTYKIYKDIATGKEKKKNGGQYNTISKHLANKS